MGTFLKICGAIMLGIIGIVVGIFLLAAAGYIHDRILIRIAKWRARKDGD